MTAPGGVPTASPEAPSRLERAREVADAVLYEGYLLFPYRGSARKNRYRWQFGVIIPQAQAAAGVAEPSRMRTECLLEAGDDCEVDVVLRFLQPRRREVERRVDGRFEPAECLEIDGAVIEPWDEAVEREVSATVAVGRLLAGAEQVPFALSGGHDVEEVADGSGEVVGRVQRTTLPVQGLIGVTADPADRDRALVKLRIDVENRTDWADPASPREEMLRRALVGAHTLLVAHGGAFLSLLDPPEWAAAYAASCANEHTYPVLVGDDGDRDVVLSSPIILYDYPSVAPESLGESYDATEIDELLSLAVSALTDEEKRRARDTDVRAAAIIDRAEAMPPELLDRLHGAIRSVSPTSSAAVPAQEPAVPAEPRTRAQALDDELAAFFGVGEEARQRLVLGDVEIAVGTRVRLRPNRRADAQDLFAAGRVARVSRIVEDVEGETYLAVTLEDDPGADLHEWYGRFLYFHPDEVELVDREQEP